MEEWFHVKHDRMVELQEIAFRVRCLSLLVAEAWCFTWNVGVLELRQFVWMCLWDFEASMCMTAWKINWGFTWNTDRGNNWKGGGVFPKRLFSAFPSWFCNCDCFTWNVVGWWLSCWGWLWSVPPLPYQLLWGLMFHVKRSIKRPTLIPATHREEATLSNSQPANQPTPPCFTWNHSSNTTKIYWTPRNNIRFPNLTPSCLLSANQEFTIHQHNHPHKQLWINSSVSRETLAFS